MTESEHKTGLIISLFVVLLVFCSAGVLFWSTRSDTQKFKIGGEQFTAELATTPASREQGLSGRASLASNQAMIFTYETIGNQCFWMRDMKFNIDIVWLDDQNKVSAMEKNVSPDSYPNNFCHVGQRVIEFASGTVDRLRLQINDQVDL